MKTLLAQLKADHPQLNFVGGDVCRWSPDTQTVVYVDSDQTANVAQVLHEVGHAQLGHSSYRLDIDLLRMEREAWEKARTIAPDYNLTIDDDTIEDDLDTYRDWLHARSCCPECSATGIQTKHLTYQCMACQTTWRVNEARLCALRRYKDQY